MIFNKSFLYAGIAVISWSTVATMFKIALNYYNHYEMLLVASFTALVIFGIVLTYQRKWKQINLLTNKQWTLLAAVGFLNPVVYYLVLFKAYNLLPAQIAQPINYSWPIFLLILFVIVFRQPIPKIKYLGMALSLGGVTLISLGSGNFEQGTIAVGGLLLAFLSAFLWATYWIVNRFNKDIDRVIVLFCSFLFGSVYLSFGCLFVETNFLKSQAGLLSSMYIGAFEMGIPFLFFGLAIHHTNNPALINQMCYLSPFLSLFLIHAVLGEEIVLTTYFGLVLIIFGIIFNEYIIKYFQKLPAT